MLDGLTSGVISFLIDILELLPESPFLVLEDLETSDFGEWLAYLNWFVPFGTFIRITAAWLAGIAAYYAYQIILRWLKVIG